MSVLALGVQSSVTHITHHCKKPIVNIERVKNETRSNGNAAGLKEKLWNRAITRIQASIIIVVIVVAVAVGAYFGITAQQGPSTETLSTEASSTVITAQTSDIVLAEVLDSRGMPVSDAEIRLLEYRNGEVLEAFSGLMPNPEFFHFQYAHNST